jgi:hypothetical protein
MKIIYNNMATKQEIDALQASAYKLTPDQLPTGYTSGGVALWRDTNAPSGSNLSTENAPGYYGSAASQLNLSNAYANRNRTNDNPNVAIRYGETDEHGNLLASRATATPQTQEQIQAEERNRIQAQIDSLENYWSQNIAPQLQQQGEQRLGETRAMGANVGLLGTPMGQAQSNKTQDYNTAITRAERAKIDAQISGLYAKADEIAIDRAEKQATLLRTDQEAYQNYLKGQTEEARNNLVTIFSSGLSPDELKSKDPDRYKTLLEQSGIDEFMADALYNTNAPKAKQIDYQYAWKGNNLVAYGQDPTTGKLVQKTYKADDLDLPVGVNPDFITDKGNNQMYWYDKDNPETDDNGNLVMKPVKSPTGNTVLGAKAASGETSNEAKLIKEFKAKVSDYIEKIGNADMDEATALKALRASYGDTFTDEELKSALGMGGEDAIRVIDEE